MIGQVIGNYRVVAEIGKGGMGMVYRAEHVQLGRPVALKMLLPQLSSDPNIVQRFFNEARAASAIDHSGIVEIYDFGTHTDGRAYIVMALLRGESLEQRLVSGPLSPHEGATILAQVAAALGAAHTRGIVHRDLKPDNIFLVPNELVPGGIQVKLLDFGIAKLADEQQAGFKTQTGALMGTPAYMSPEQCMGRADLDHRTDIYSLGCILFHVLCGRPPFTSDQGTGMMIAAHIRDAAPDPRTINPRVPADLVAIIMRCLEKEPGARFQTANDLRNALVAAGANAPLSKPPQPALGFAATMAPGMQQPLAFGTAPTTHSSAAAQVMTSQPPPAAKKSRAGMWIGIGAMTAIAGAAIAIAATREPAKKEVVAATPAGSASAELPKPEPAQPEPAQPAPTRPEPTRLVAEVSPVTDAKKVESCTDGKITNVDTRGHCCWADQVWSEAKSRCLGKPTCPPGMTVKGEACIATVAASTPPPHGGGAHVPPPPPPPDVDNTPVPMFAVSAKTYRPGDTVDITFGSPVSSKSGNQAWVTISEKGAPPTSYGPWDYVKDGATEAQLKAPKRAGDYEVRIHTNYPTKSYNVRYSVPIAVREAGTAAPAEVTPLAKQRFHLARKTVKAGKDAVLEFPQPMHAVAGEKFWITVVEPGTPPTGYGHYVYVDEDAKTARIPVPTAPGDYEVRLHANYPTKTTNLVHRERIHVE